MLEKIVLRGALSGSPTRAAIRLEIFDIERADWVEIGRAQAGRGNTFRAEIEGEPVKGMRSAPMARLTRRGDVLATAPAEMKVDGGVLLLDFGTIDPQGADDAVALRRLQRDLTNRDAQVDSLRIERNDIRAELTEIQAVRTDLTGAIALRDGQIRDLQNRADTAAPVATATVDNIPAQEVSRLKIQLLTAETEAQDKSARLQTLAGQLETMTRQRDALSVDIADLRASDEAAPRITDLTTTIAGSLNAMEAQGVALSDARITLRGYLAGGGQRFKPLDSVELSRTAAGAASEISFTVRPVAEGDAARTMPDLVGLTPASARRAMRPLGHAVEVTEAAGNPAGAILRHAPAAGEALPPGTAIRLMVGTGDNEET